MTFWGFRLIWPWPVPSPSGPYLHISAGISNVVERRYSNSPLYVALYLDLLVFLLGGYLGDVFFRFEVSYAGACSCMSFMLSLGTTLRAAGGGNTVTFWFA